MRITCVQYRLKRYTVGDLDIDVVSKVRDVKLYKVRILEITLTEYVNGRKVVTVDARGAVYRNGKIRANATQKTLYDITRFILPQLDNILREIGDEELTAAFWAQYEKDAAKGFV